MNARVLILAPTARDASVTEQALSALGLNCVVCRNIRHLLSLAEAGVGTILLTDECFTDADLGSLLRHVIEQPSWSDLPIVLLLREAPQIHPTADIIRLLGNVTLLERPAPMRSVGSAVQVAVRSRMRQYQIRDQLAQLHAADQEKQNLLKREKTARSEAERSSRLKDEFLATLSHELRTPLNAILGWSQVINRTKATGDALAEGLAAIERNARAQAQLIADLLDMSRIISGKVRIELESIDPASVVNAALDAVRPSAEAKGVTLAAEIGRGVEPIIGDPNRLQQVVWNLLTNAIKFTPREGRVDIRLGVAGGAIEIAVSDTGQGIDPEFLPHVFERFRQADASTTRTHGGLGLGLSIVKQLVEMHGGSVSADSRGRGRGATFTVRLPMLLGPPAREAASPAAEVAASDALEETLSASAIDGLRVLVVDDEPDTRTLLRRVLENCHAEVVTAGSAREAISRLDHFVPEVIVSDIAMPQQDGYELLASVRARGIAAPAIALTAFARSDDRRRSLGSGFQLHMTKPVEPAELIESIARVAGRVHVEG